jgi:hypothetical protein
MSTLLRFRALAAIAVLFVVFPTFLLSQVTIRERVEIKPRSPDKQTAEIQHPARTADASDIFYDPPLFVEDPLFHRMGLTLPSTVTISGTVDIAGSIGTNQHALLIYSDPSGADHEIAAKGRDAIGFGGNMYERQTPFTGPLNKGLFPSISLYLFDSQWVTRIGEVTMDGNTLTYSFSGLLDEHTAPAAEVTATATVTGSFQPDFQFDHWEILTQNLNVTGHDSTLVRFAPMDGTAEPGEFSTPSLYRPWGIPWSSVSITARVDAGGDYVFLAYRESVEGGGGAYHSGKELTPSLTNTTFLVYDDSHGTFDGPTGTVQITVTGGGKSVTVPVVLTKNVILLGETKYYYVADVDGWLKIMETSSTSEPEDLITDFEWGPEPVEVVESGPKSGKRLGVYWERKKPDGTDLPTGMIRLVGRYWHADSVYKVRLSATDSYGETVSIVIEVEKPEELLDRKVFSKPYALTWNIRNEPLDIDSLCIDNAARIGISPQIIKAQMYQESDKTGDRFNPSYRYEPWKDYQFSSEKLNPRYWKDYQKQPFWVTGQTPKPMGEGKDVPLDHQNVKPLYYPAIPISIADYTISNWDQYVLLAKDSIIGNRELTKDFRRYLETYKDYWLLPFVGEGQYLLATRRIQQDIRDKYTDYAQTRKAASYGLIQMLYTTALVQEYNKGKTISTSQTPEELNDETVEMPFYSAFTEKNLRLQFGSETTNVPDGNWPKGWEQTWMDSFMKYNSNPDYAMSVISHARKFYPQKKQGAL